MKLSYLEAALQRTIAMRLVALLWVFLLIPSALAQMNKQRDSLVNALSQVASDTTRCTILLDLAEMHAGSDTLMCKVYLEQALELGRLIEDKKHLGRAHKIRGKSLVHLGEYEEAILEYDRALSFYNEADENIEYYETLKNKGNVYLFMSEYVQAQTYYETALDYYRRNGMNQGASRCLNNLGIIHKNRGDYVDALSVYQESIQLLKNLDAHMELAQGYINMGNIYVFLGIYDRALEYYENALILAEKEGSRKDYALCLMNTAVVQTKCGNLGEAHASYLKSLTIAREMGNPIQISNCLVNLGTNQAAMGHFEKGLEYVRQGLAIKEELGDQRTISNGYITLAEIHSMVGNHEEAISLLNKAAPIKEELGDREGLVRCYLGLAQISFDKNNYSVTRQMATEAQVLAEELGSLEHLATAFSLKENEAARRGDFRTAYEFKQKHQEISDSLLDESTSKAVMEMEFRHRSKALSQENENLKIQSTLTAELMKKRSAFLYSIVSISVLLTAGMILGIIVFRRLRRSARKVEEKNLVITRQNLKLDTLNRTKDRMMSIIAHDLRGTIGNQLTAIEVLNRVEASNQPDFDKKKLLGNLKHSATYSLELLENLLHWSRLEEKESYFHPERIDLGMLVRVCVSLFNETAVSKGIRIENELNSETWIHADKIMLETMLRNLLSNAIKFSESDTVISLRSKTMNDKLSLVIDDQGIGMSPEQIDKVLHNGGYSRRGTANEKGAGIGMTLVREFAATHNAGLDIDSQTGKGTQITLTFENGEANG